MASHLTSALEEARKQYAAEHPKSAEAHRFAQECMPGGSTRSSIFVHPFPIHIARGEGNRLTDVDGNVYTDFVSDFTSGLYGKSHPVVRQAVLDALDNGLQLGAHSASEARLAGLIRARFRSIDLVRFANSGTEANLLAISTAITYTKRSKVIVYENGYHGSLLSGFYCEDEGRSSRYLKAPYEFIIRPYNDLTSTRKAFEDHAGEVAAVLIEPMLGAGGCIPGDPDFLWGLRGLCDESGALLIFDEVQTARLAPGGRQEVLDIMPDLTTLGKFFGGGFAFGAFGGSEKVMRMFDMTRPDAVGHGGTFNNSPCTMAAGAAAIEHVATKSALARLNALGDELRDRVNEGFSAHYAPFKMTGLGSLNQLHSTLPDKHDQTQAMELLYFRLLEKEIWIAQRGLISLSLVHEAEEVRAFGEALAGIGAEIAGLITKQ